MRSLFLSLAVLGACTATATIDDDDGDGVPDPSDTDPVDSGTDPVDSGTDPGDSGTDPGDTGTAAPTVADLAKPGPNTVATNDANMNFGGESCGLLPKQFTRARPQGGQIGSTVAVLVHGFQRGRENMVGWARHLASYGFESVAVSLCTGGLLEFAVDHPKNGRALANFVEATYPGKDVVLIGYSAGGLAAVLAAQDADNVVAVFGLDMVDSNGTGGGPIPPSNDPNFGLLAAPDLAVPFWGIKGEPSDCNADGNGDAVYDAAPEGRVLTLVEAGHCDFERPRNAGIIPCTVACPDPGNTFTNEEQGDVLAAMLVAFLQKTAGVNGTIPDAFWTSGQQPYTDLTSATGPLAE